VLRQRPTGSAGREHFDWQEQPLPSIREGEFLVRNILISCDPAQRTWMELDTYIPMVPLGEVMASFAMGEVVESKHPDYAEGELVSGMFGWQDYAVCDGRSLGGVSPPLKVPPGVDLPTAMALFSFGGGLTSYFGLLDVGQAAAGDTVLVSGAMGAVGSIVCQIAKLKGCRVVGIAGGQRKCDFLRDALGVEAIDYKTEELSQRLAELCPDGIDVVYDNVGPEILDAALACLALHARVVICGEISAYNDFARRPGLHNHIFLVLQRATMRGFLIFDYADRAEEAITELAAWAGEGKLKVPVDIVEGLENVPQAFGRLFTGENFGKQMVKVADR
jgi:NADPH-dependent curcumin reductase CurA